MRCYSHQALGVPLIHLDGCYSIYAEPNANCPWWWRREPCMPKSVPARRSRISKQLWRQSHNSYQWCANQDILNLDPNPNPDTSNPNSDESESISISLNPNPNPGSSNLNPDSNLTAPDGRKVTCDRQAEVRIRIHIRIRIHPSFLESESGSTFLRSESESHITDSYHAYRSLSYLY